MQGDETTDDDAAWAALRRRWEDDAAHREFLARRPGLEGLAEAGRRYREALDRDPRDAVALRWRDEIVRRATALAFAQLPRTAPPPPARPVRRVLLALAAAAAAALATWLALRGQGPPGAIP